MLEKVHDFVTSNGIDCDFNYTTTMDACLSQDFADYQAKAMAAYRAAGGDVSQVKFYEGEEAKAKTKVPSAICAYEWPAGSNHPAKLCQWILNDVISNGVKLWTHCPATRISKRELSVESDFRWDVHTPRGKVAADTIIYCTNAYAALLLPNLAKFVTPKSAQSHSFVPPPCFSGENTFKSKMSLRYSLHNFFSMNQLRDGTIILGGSGTGSASDWDAEMLARKETFDDSTYSHKIKENSTREFTKLAQSVGYTTPLRHGEGLSHVWTGIIGMTPDSVPLVGPMEGLDGQWICAGFNGHGEHSCT